VGKNHGELGRDQDPIVLLPKKTRAAQSQLDNETASVRAVSIVKAIGRVRPHLLGSRLDKSECVPGIEPICGLGHGPHWTVPSLTWRNKVFHPIATHAK
jgi:hypothetical protein